MQHQLEEKIIRKLHVTENKKIPTYFFPPKFDKRSHQNEFVIYSFTDQSRHDPHERQTDITNSHATIEDDNKWKYVEKYVRSDFYHSSN